MTTPLLYSEDAAAPAFDAVPSTEHLLRTKEIPWDIYMTARLISDQDLQLLRRYDKRDAAQRSRLLAEGGPRYLAALLSVLQNVTKDETVQYVLALLDDMLTADSARAALFHHMDASGSGGGGGGGGIEDPAPVADPYSVLLHLLQRNDWFTQEKAAQALSAALAARPRKGTLARAIAEGGAQSNPVARTMGSFLDWIVAQLRRPSHPTRGVATAVHCLSVLLRDAPVRSMFLRVGGGPLLAPLVRMPPPGGQLNIQLLYEAVLCCWELSFHRPAADALATAPLVGGLVDVVRLAQKEKLVRAALLALRNLLGEGAPAALEFAVVEKGLARAVETRSAQNWDDPDVPALLEWTASRLEEGVLALTSLERYRREVASGVLRRSPLHDSDAFWAENAERLVDSNCALLKQVLALLAAARDPATLAVACRDVGQFVVFHPSGRGAVGQLGGKEAVMRLMAHQDPEVQREALLCVQRLLLPRDKADVLQGGGAA
jgi:V-type H+-transporting ATPase subunit H